MTPAANNLFFLKKIDYKLNHKIYIWTIHPFLFVSSVLIVDVLNSQLIYPSMKIKAQWK